MMGRGIPCEVSEFIHISPPCNCKERIHLWEDKYCICKSKRYCKDAWKVTKQEEAAKYHLKGDQLLEWFEMENEE